MYEQEMLSISRSVLEYFYMTLYIDYFSYLHKKKTFLAASTYDTNVKYQKWNFSCNLFLNYAANRHTDTHRDTHRLTQRHTGRHT